MSETVNIAALAATASEKIFSAFGWVMHGIQDENFPCDKIDKHQTKGAGGTHPVDCVFSYPDPFSRKTVFLLCDLKSYAQSTIGTTDFAPYIRGLAKAIDCASASETWKTRYVEPGIEDWAVDGLLFVYNHDQTCVSDFKAKAKGLSPNSLPHSRAARVHLLDPGDITYLQSVVSDMKAVCGERELEYAKRRFFYPQQLLHTPRESLLPVATIEMVRGKMLIAAFPERLLPNSQFYVYLRNSGSVQDFEYVVTYIFRNGIMNLADTVTIKGVDFCSEAQVNFDAGKKQFWSRHYRMKEIASALERIKFGRVDRATSGFSSVDESKRRAK